MTMSAWIAALLVAALASSAAAQQARRIGALLWWSIVATSVASCFLAALHAGAARSPSTARRATTAIDVSVWLLSVALCVTTTTALRPLLAWAPVRWTARLCGAALVACFAGGLLHQADDGRTASQPLLLGTSAALATIALAVVFVAVAALLGQHRRVDRRTELVVLVAMALHAAGLTASSWHATTAHAVFVATGNAVVLFAAVRCTSPRVGTPLGGTRVTADVSCRSAMCAVVVAGLAGLADVHLGPAWGATLFALATAAIAFHVRELGGGLKPLLLPFSRREVAAHHVFNDVLRRDVRLVGRVVRRSTDDAIVAIEAEPDWSRSRVRRGRARPLGPVRAAARDARLEGELDAISIDLGVVHAPAVLHGLANDEPWLSVPLALATVGRGPIHVDLASPVDGLVLRIDQWPSADMAAGIERWQDCGAAIHVDPQQLQTDPAANLPAFEPDIVTVDPTVPLPRRVGHPQTLSRLASATSRRPHATDFVVDVAQRAVDLGVLLSSISTRQPGEYVRRISFESLP